MNHDSPIDRRTFLRHTLVSSAVAGGSSIAADSAVAQQNDSRLRWRFETGNMVDSSPVVANETVYVGSDDANVYALNAVDGTEQWRFETGNQVRSSPAMANGTIYVGGYDANIYALNAVDGTEQWRFETGHTIYSSPAVANETVYVGSWDDNIYALNAANGTEQWRFETSDWVSSSPVVANEAVYVGSDDANIYALNAVDGIERWRFETGDEISDGPAVANGTVYVGSDDANVYALNAADGTEQWRFETGGEVASPAVVDETVYVVSFDNNIYALNAADGTEQWHFETGSPVSSSPAVVGSTVYVGSHDVNVYALNAVDGTEQWRFETSGLVSSSPAVANGTVYVGSYDSSVYALNAPKSTADPQRGKTSLALTTQDVTARPGEEATLEFTLRNDGTKAASNPKIRVTSLTVTESWYHEFRSDRGDWRLPSATWTIDSLPPGESQTPSMVVVVPSGTDPGEYTVDAKALDGDGNTVDTASATILVKEREDTDPPAAAFTYSPQNPSVGAEVTFDASDSRDPNGSVTAYEWDLDSDGEYEVTGSKITDAFDWAGERNVTLRVTDDSGTTATTTRTVPVSAGVANIALPVTPVPGEPLQAIGLVASGPSRNGSATARLFLNDQRITERSIDLSEEQTMVYWSPSTTFSPGEHTVRMTVEDVGERSRTVRVPQLAVSEMYTQPVYTNVDSDQETEHNTETTIEIENSSSTEGAATARFTLAARTTNSSDELETVGEQTVQIDPGSSRRLYFPWSSSSRRPHYLEFEMTVASGGSDTLRAWYSPLGRPLPTEIAYAAGTAPRGSGMSANGVHIAKMAEFTDLALSSDQSTLYVPAGGDGKIEVEVLNSRNERLGKTEKAVDTTAMIGPVTEAIRGIEWVEVPVEVPDDTQYLIVHVRQEQGVLWAIGKGIIGGLVSLAKITANLSEDKARREERSPAVEADPYALEYDHITVAEVSGYPESTDLRGFARQIASEPAEKYEDSTTKEALQEVISIAADLTDSTAGPLLTLLSVGTSIGEEVADELDDTFGIQLGFDDLEIANEQQIGKLSVYDYGTDDPGIGTDTQQLNRHRTVDLQTTGVTGGTANVTLSYSDAKATVVNDESRPLDLVYLQNDEWKTADMVEADRDEKTVSGSIPAADLTETPVAVITRPRGGGSGTDGIKAEGIPEWLPIAGGAGILGVGAAGAYKYFTAERDERGQEVSNHE